MARNMKHLPMIRIFRFEDRMVTSGRFADKLEKLSFRCTAFVLPFHQVFERAAKIPWRQ